MCVLRTSRLKPARLQIAFGYSTAAAMKYSYNFDSAFNVYSCFRQNKPYVEMDQSDTTDLQQFHCSMDGPYLQRRCQCPLAEGYRGGQHGCLYAGVWHVAGYWVHEDADNRSIFFDQDGNGIRLQRIESWININSERSNTVAYEQTNAKCLKGYCDPIICVC